MSPFHRTRKTSRAGRIGAATAVMLAAGALLASPSMAQPGRAAKPAAEAKPTVVLVHGAWADGSSWSPVTRRLQRDGYTVDVVANPLRGVASDAAYLDAVLKTISGPIVLAGHSYGGAVITNVANPNVKALVYVDAFIPDQGENVIQLAGAKPGSQLGGDPTQVFDFVPYPGAVNGDVDLYVKPSLFPGAFANDLPKAQGEELAASQRPLTLSGANEPSGPPAWKTTPSWALVGTKDNVIPPAEQLAMAERAHAKITQVGASHLSMLSHPKDVERVITQAANASR
jgi:pimeloyl-ACP methyl ester carboxylesterase